METKPKMSTFDAEDSVPDIPLTPFIKVITVLSAIGGFLIGYDLGILSGAMILLKKQYNLSTIWQELIVSTAIACAAIASLTGGILNNVLGRKPVILSTSAMFAVGAGVLAVAPDKEVLLVGQLVIGLGVGLAATTIPVFILESSPTHYRGLLVTVFGCSYAGGTTTAGIMGGVFSFYPWGWRPMFGIAAVPAIIQFIGFLFLPESPCWLVRQGRDQNAMDVLQRINGTKRGVEEYENIRNAEQRREKQDSEDRNVIQRVLETPAVRKALLVGCGLQVIQQFSGINAVIYYNATIIRMSGEESDVVTLWLAAAVSSCSFIGNILCLYLINKAGRRTLTLSSLAGMIVCLVLIGITFLLISLTSPPVSVKTPYAGACATYSFCNECISQKTCGFCYLEDNGSLVNNTGSCLPVDKKDIMHAAVGLCSETNKTSNTIWAFDFCPSSFGYMALVGMVAYLLIFGQGMGPMPWLVNTEIYPTWARSFCNGCATATNWICNLIISMTFLSLTEAITPHGTYLLFAGISMLGFIFLFILLPETKGKGINEINDLFTEPMCSCYGESSASYTKLERSDEDCH